MPATKKRTKKNRKPTFNVPTKDQLDFDSANTKVRITDYEIGSSAVSMRTDLVGIEFGDTEDKIVAAILIDSDMQAVRFGIGRGRRDSDVGFDLAMDRETLGLQIDYDHDEQEFTFYSETDEEWYYVSDGITLADQIEGTDEKWADSDDDLILSTVLQQIKGRARSTIINALNEYGRSTN